MSDICLKYYNNNNNNNNNNYQLRNLIHNYGCQHLQLTMPNILNNAMKQAHHHNQLKIFTSRIELEFYIFSRFLHELKNI